MANQPEIRLKFDAGCPDCGRREADLPRRLPPVGDDFDWLTRDYDGFRLFMLEELAARFPERRRWTTADFEVVLVEMLAAVLDQLSDMADRVAGEAYLDSARQPESVLRHLRLIGYDAVNAENPDWLAEKQNDVMALIDLWRRELQRMEAARRAGPRDVHRQKRMVSLNDYNVLLAEHPLVERAAASGEWSGAWPVLRVAVTLAEDIALDIGMTRQAADSPELRQRVTELRERIEWFNKTLDLPVPLWTGDPTPRMLLQPYLERYRLAGQEVILEDARRVGIVIFLSVRVGESYFQTEVRRAIEERLGRGPGGFFRPGRLRFGEDLHASDLIQALVALDGVDSVCLNRFKRVGRAYPDQSESGLIELRGLEIAVCDNNAAKTARGYFRITLHGGGRG